MKRRMMAFLLLALLACPAALAGGGEETAALQEAMRVDLVKLEAERGAGYYLWTVEERHAFYEKHRLAQDVLHAGAEGLPGEEDVQLPEAMMLAEEAVAEKYGAEALMTYSDMDYGTRFLVSPDGPRYWEISFYLGSEEHRYSIYHVTLDARTGEVLSV